LFRSDTVGRRIAGIHAAMAKHKLRFATEESCWEWEPQHGFELTRKVLAQHPDVTALLCLNDRLAFGAYQALAEVRRAVPGDISIVAFDNDEIAGYLRPGLTTIALPHEEMGRASVRLLLSPDTSGEHLVSMPVVVRASI
jgi:LacI family transcriptional regulator